MFIKPGTYAGDTNIEFCRVADGTTVIGRAAYAACLKLTKVVLPNSLVRIDDAAFVSCPLSKVIYLGTYEEWKRVEKGAGIWSNDVVVVCAPARGLVKISAADACMLHSCINEIIWSYSAYACQNNSNLRRCSGRLDLLLAHTTPETIPMRLSLANAIVECIELSRKDFGARYCAVKRLKHAIAVAEARMFD